MKKTSSMLALSCQKRFKLSRYIDLEALAMLSATGILSASITKRLVIEQGRLLKKEWWVRSCKFQRNCKLQFFIIKLRVANCKLNLVLQFSKTFADSNFKTAKC